MQQPDVIMMAGAGSAYRQRDLRWLPGRNPPIRKTAWSWTSRRGAMPPPLHDANIGRWVTTCLGHAAEESATLEAVIQARNAAMTAQGPQAQAAAEQQLSGTLGRLIALSEAYPDLKANANFQQLQAQLTDIENKLAAARRFFNNAVSEYNARIQQFPAALFAASFGFTSKPFFDLGAERKTVQEVPQVKF